MNKGNIKTETRIDLYVVVESTIVNIGMYQQNVSEQIRIRDYLTFFAHLII